MMTITEASTHDTSTLENLNKPQAHIKINPQQENVISVCGVLVLVHPDKREATEARMLEIPGLEIHGASEEGKLVITVQTDSYRETGDAITRLQNVKGILSISMIYQHAEAIEDESPLDKSNDKPEPKTRSTKEKLES